MGSPAAASLVAHLAFWALVGWGMVTGELTWRRAAMFVGVWLWLPFGFAYTSYGPSLYSPVVAVLDIILVFVVLKGDVRLT